MISIHPDAQAPPQSNVGAGLPAKAVCQLMHPVPDTPLSQASQLPLFDLHASRCLGATPILTFDLYAPGCPCPTPIQCGSGLAREGSVSVDASGA
ncbi:hypothetical protein C9382_15665 [Pseudomonas aylmerensis]|uniref:Uncharacterized protein n=1 Tax=Pseudomonas aylmerensis TaxID=1869229 RepID=A0A2T4FWU0_9PSED|nr:hypothetical protein C9382_15665 [Pseudomonas aylmerensis]